jgi:tRNA-Thr(GGU) m(6)t(6)A37 methyltransferase TsaA
MAEAENYSVKPVGVVRSPLKERGGAPRQGYEGAPDAWIEIEPAVAEAMRGVEAGQDVILITWLHLTRRDVLVVHPRWAAEGELYGVFAARSPDRPNPLGLHRVTVREIADGRLRVGPLEAIDGTPVVDIKPVLQHWNDA